MKTFRITGHSSVRMLGFFGLVLLSVAIFSPDFFGVSSAPKRNKKKRQRAEKTQSRIIAQPPVPMVFSRGQAPPVSTKAQVKPGKSKPAAPPEKTETQSTKPIENELGELFVKPGGKNRSFVDSPLRPKTPVLPGPSYTTEVEPNGTTGTATAIGTPARIQSNLFPNGDIDFYSFNATAGDRIYAATMTSGSAGSSTDSQMTLLASDGTTVIEFDDDNGSFAGLSSSIAGAVIPSNGTYFIKINDFTAGTTSERPYELYVRVQSGSPTAETEPNDTPGTANALPGNGWVSGARDPASATEQDWYSMTLNAGDTVFLSLDVDPEDDLTVWNGRLGFALFGDTNNQILVVDDAGTGDAGPPVNPNRPSEAMFFTVKNAGTYYAFVDSASAAVGGPTATYNLSVTVYPKVNEGVNCTTYTSTNVPQTIGPGNGLVSSTITVPGNPRIADLDVSIQLNHAVMQDIDAHLRSPAGNDNGLFSDIGAGVTGGQAQMDLTFDDEAAIPPAFTVMRPIVLKPELIYRLNWFDGEDAGGTWTLDLYDDTTGANGGTLTGWSLRICEQPTLSGATVYSENFDGGGGTDGGFTHSGTADEWARGLPATAATSTANPVAAFTTCNSGTNCWKTDLTGTYNVSSNQDLKSPSINLTAATGQLTLEWAMRYQIESATFDHGRVIVQQAGLPATAKTVWQFLDATMTDVPGNPTVNAPASAGWGRYRTDVSSFAGQNIEVIFHLDSDTTINFGGLAVDDVNIVQGGAVTGGKLLISEFRLRGPNPNAAQNEFIELYNNTNAPFVVASSDGSSGYGVAASDGLLRCTIPNGTTIPARGHALCANSAAYSLGGYGTPDFTYTLDIPDNAGIALFSSTTTFTLATRLDAVGSTSEGNTLYKEGTGYPALAPSSIEYAFVRDNCGKGGSITTFGPCPSGPTPNDTDNNAADFFFVDTNGTSAGAGQRLGAPGPENLSSPIQNTSAYTVLLLDSTVGVASPPNRVRDFTSDPPNNSTAGTLEIRKRLVNSTGGAVTRLRYRIVDFSTFPAPFGFADLRARTSGLVVVSGINDAGTCFASNGSATTPCTVNVEGTTVEIPPSQLNGGGFNTTLSSGTITLATPLANGASLNVRFLLGIQQTGRYKAYVIIEALP